MVKKRLPHAVDIEGDATTNVVVLHPRITQRHTALLARWLEAGRRMGLCDASAFFPDRSERQRDYVLVWVRENPDPAYMIRFEAGSWAVIDAVREHELARLPNFAAALHFIRPVLPLEAAA